MARIIKVVRVAVISRGVEDHGIAWAGRNHPSVGESASAGWECPGNTDIKKGVTYSRFETVPDAPITSFETSLPQGPHSVLAATGNLCTTKLSTPTALTGQNGAQVNQNTPVTVTGCPKAKTLTRAQKLALALKACHKKPKGAKRTSCERAAHKKYGPLKKAKKATKKK